MLEQTDAEHAAQAALLRYRGKTPTEPIRQGVAARCGGPATAGAHAPGPARSIPVEPAGEA